jgi:hypothetical protein
VCTLVTRAQADLHAFVDAVCDVEEEVHELGISFGARVLAARSRGRRFPSRGFGSSLRTVARPVPERYGAPRRKSSFSR